MQASKAITLARLQERMLIGSDQAVRSQDTVQPEVGDELHSQDSLSLFSAVAFNFIPVQFTISCSTVFVLKPCFNQIVTSNHSYFTHVLRILLIFVKSCNKV